MSVDKPPYRLPSMPEVRAVPWNGYTAASLFAGAGGSSLGYRMAGYRIAWASEFVEAARDTYLANADQATILDGRDIRDVTPEDILADLTLDTGELDLLDGSPPCGSFSTAGRQQDSWGQVKDYSETEQRSDDLFFEYARILAGLQPRVFVAENVAGLVRGAAKGYFKDIMQALKGAGYRVNARLLDAQWLGVPQVRSRLIFVGVREDLGLEPVHPQPLPYRYGVRDVLPYIVSQGDNGSYGRGRMQDAAAPSPTIGTRPWTGNGDFPPGYVTVRQRAAGPPVDPETGHDLTVANRRDDPNAEFPRRRMTLGECRAVCGFPQDFELTGGYRQRWERLGRAVPPPMSAAIGGAIRDRVLKVADAHA